MGHIVTVDLKKKKVMLLIVPLYLSYVYFYLLFIITRIH